MAQGKPRDPRKEQQWRRWILRWQQSGLSVRAFCARHHLSPPNFYAWRRAIRQRDATAGTFVPVQVVPAVLRGTAPSPTNTWEVVLAGGRMVRVAAGFDPTTLRDLLAILEEVPSC